MFTNIVKTNERKSKQKQIQINLVTFELKA